MTTEPKWTKGPLTVSITDAWPFYIITSDANGKTVFQDDLPCHTTSDKTAADAIAGRGFPAHEREKVREINERAIADATIRAAAPDLYQALEECQKILDILARPRSKCTNSEAINAWANCIQAELHARKALSRARGESQ